MSRAERGKLLGATSVLPAVTAGTPLAVRARRAARQPYRIAPIPDPPLPERFR